jgi:hypothetical protein
MKHGLVAGLANAGQHNMDSDTADCRGLEQTQKLRAKKK